MKLKNANIQSKEELINRLFNTREIFYTEVNGYLEKIYYAHDKLGNPFIREQVVKVLQRTPNRIPINNMLDRYSEMFIEIPHTWEDDLVHGPILCKVWNSNGIPYFVYIQSASRAGYLQVGEKLNWKYAEPVIPSMLYNPEDFR